MSNKITGHEPAMPAKGERYDDRLGDIPVYYTGLTIRQQLAAMAMQGILANNEGAMTSSSSRSFHPDTIAKYAVICAESLIKELNK